MADNFKCRHNDIFALFPEAATHWGLASDTVLVEEFPSGSRASTIPGSLKLGKRPEEFFTPQSSIDVFSPLPSAVYRLPTSPYKLNELQTVTLFKSAFPPLFTLDNLQIEFDG